MQVGRKDDTGKPQWSLLPIREVRDVVKVLTFGATTYAPENWKYIHRPRERYYDAAMRHLAEWKMGHIKDGQSKLPHLAHAICCLLFLMWFDRKDRRVR